MHPILFQIGPLKLYTYGLMMGIGFLTAIMWAMKRAPRYGVSSEFISNLGMWIIVAGVVGGRAAFLVLEQNPADLFSFRFFEVWQGGMVFYGGLILSIVVAWWYSSRNKVHFLTVADICSPAVLIGLFFGRLGCTAAGCCYGKECELPWAITFTNPLSLAPLHVRLHPTQLYEAFGALVIIGILLLIQKRQKFRGQIFIMFILLYAILRPSVEAFRGDTERGFVEFWGLYPNEWLSTSTFISILMLALAGFLWWKNKDVPSSYQTQ